VSILRAVLGLLLIPVCVAFSRTLLSLMASLGAAPGMAQVLPALALGLGIVLWVVIFSFLPRPVRTYVLAHELTHALWGSIFGARVSGLKVSKNGGSVRVSEINWFTALAPYFFPFYAVLVALAYCLLALVADLRRWELVWFGLLGLTLGFHWTFTLDALAQSQSDIRRYGRLFSYTVIYLLNLLVVGLVLMLATPVTSAQFVGRMIADIAWAFHGCWLAGETVFRWASQSGAP
jgi:hypothetical protein